MKSAETFFIGLCLLSAAAYVTLGMMIRGFHAEIEELENGE